MSKTWEDILEFPSTRPDCPNCGKPGLTGELKGSRTNCEICGCFVLIEGNIALPLIIQGITDDKGVPLNG